MSDFDREFIDVNGCKIGLRRGGKGETLLFLHGAGGADGSLALANRMADSKQVILPSHPGFDHSDTPDWLDNFQDLVFFYLDFLDQLDLKDIHLVGHSLGGWLAVEIAVRNATRLKSLTLVSAAGIHVKGCQKGDIFLWTPEDAVRNLVHDQSLAERMLAVNLPEEEADVPIKNRFTTAKMAWSPRFYNPDLAKWLHRVKLPTLIVWGEDDKIFPAPYAKAYQKLIPGSKLEVFSQCGHLPHVEKQDDFVRALEGHIKGTG